MFVGYVQSFRPELPASAPPTATQPYRQLAEAKDSTTFVCASACYSGTFVVICFSRSGRKFQSDNGSAALLRRRTAFFVAWDTCRGLPGELAERNSK